MLHAHDLKLYTVGMKYVVLLIITGHADNRDATHITHPLSEITNSDSNFPTFADRNKRHLDPVPIYSTSEAEWRLHQQVSEHHFLFYKIFCISLQRRHVR